MEPITYDGYVEHLRREAALLRAAAPADRLAEPVPSCPGWSFTDLVDHTALVYLHKVACMQLQRPPDPWPPERGDAPLLARFDDALEQLLHELTTRDPAAPGSGWYPFDRTVGFWARRMAQETFVHRFDAELTTRGAVGDVDAELALDGIDEVLVRFLAGDWSDGPVPEAAGTVVGVRSGGRTWRVVLEPSAVVTVPDPTYDLPVAGTVSGPPGDVLLWAWGRGPVERVEVEGAPAVTALRARLVTATQ